MIVAVAVVVLVGGRVRVVIVVAVWCENRPAQTERYSPRQSTCWSRDPRSTPTIWTWTWNHSHIRVPQWRHEWSCHQFFLSWRAEKNNTHTFWLRLWRLVTLCVLGTVYKITYLLTYLHTHTHTYRQTERQTAGNATFLLHTVNAVVTTTIRLRCDYHSTVVRFPFNCQLSALRPFDDLRYDRKPTCCVLLHWGLNK